MGLADLVPYIDSVPGSTRDFLEGALRAGDECSACFYRQERVAFNFNKRSRTLVTDQLDVLIAKGFLYAYKTWTHPAHTRRKLQKLCTHVKYASGRRPFNARHAKRIGFEFLRKDDPGVRHYAA